METCDPGEDQRKKGWRETPNVPWVSERGVHTRGRQANWWGRGLPGEKGCGGKWGKGDRETTILGREEGTEALFPREKNP